VTIKNCIAKLVNVIMNNRGMLLQPNTHPLNPVSPYC